MKTHVVSIFPLQGAAEYARITITAYADTTLPPVAPRLANLAQVLETVKLLVPEDVQQIMSELDWGIPLQVSVTEDQALVISIATTSMPV